MRSVLAFAVVLALVLPLGVWLLGLAFPTPADHRGLVVGASVAFVVQLIAFLVLRFGDRENPIAMWGVGMLLRMLTIGVFAFLLNSAFGLPSGATLIGLVAFFFVSSLFEPLLLKL